MSDRARRAERALRVPLLVASALVIPELVIEALHAGEPWRALGLIANWVSWLTFLASAVIMLALIPERGRWLRRHAVDVLVVILSQPFAIGPLQSLRVLRLVRLLRLAPLATWLLSREGLRFIAVVAVVTAIGGGAEYAGLEKHASIADGIYWSITTMTTVAYGDFVPHTGETRLLAIILVLLGISFVAVLTGAVAQRLLAREVREVESRAVAEAKSELVETEQDIGALVTDVYRSLRRLEEALNPPQRR